METLSYQNKNRKVQFTVDSCAVCKDSNWLQNTDGFAVCGSCGTCGSENSLVCESAEWRVFESMEGNDPTRAERGNDLLFDPLSTSFQVSGTGAASGTSSGPSMSCQRNLKSSGDKTLIQMFSEIDKMGSTLLLPDGYIAEAKELYSRFEKTRPKTSRFKRDVLAAAMLFVACKVKGAPRTAKEIGGSTNIPELAIKRYYMAISKCLNLDLNLTTPQVLLARFCSNLGLGFEYEKYSIMVAEKARDLLEGKNPSSIAATCLYFTLQMSREKKTLVEVSNASGVSQSTIYSLYYTLANVRDRIIPAAFWDSKIASRKD
eukprot:TRINITY_DN139_c0_g1_i1.p1 TRINITY_DN139_c0_g1~~TRINITY_DN139_c0_g1_i1.p1  ORF type:complete len:317 (-),score=52.26 TRINITY_DN139_c0_g1_i1:239-1189(-)